jgi:hypothetical protein
MQEQLQSDRAVEHFKDIVALTAEEYLRPEHLNSVRHGYQAASMLAHMAEHFYEARCAGSDRSQCNGKKDGKEFLEDLAARNPDYALLADVSNASKHAVLRPTIRGRCRDFISSENIRQGTSAANSIEPANSSLPINQDALFVYFDIGPKAGTGCYLFPAVQRVLTFWREELGLPT